MAQDNKWHITVVSEFSGKIWSSLSQRSIIQKTEIFHNTLRNTQASIFTV